MFPQSLGIADSFTVNNPLYASCPLRVGTILILNGRNFACHYNKAIFKSGNGESGKSRNYRIE